MDLRAPLHDTLHTPLCAISVLLSALLKSDWLPLHDPILNANFSPISALLSRSTYLSTLSIKCQGLPSTLSPNLSGTAIQ